MNKSMTNFVTVATTDELKPGERLVVEINRRWILLVNVDGQYYAIEDNCTHEEHPLSEGQLDGCSIECSKHGAVFDLRNGEVQAPPAHLPVRTFDVRVEGNEVQVAY